MTRYKMDKSSIVNDIYHASVLSALSAGYSMIGKKLFKLSPPSIKKFDLEDLGKLVAIVASSEITMRYLISQKIIPEKINV